ncbi:MAG TPA: cbb3-type cytochrome c oxidase N-terminal domain-containing protein, partial [Noviherbaspirillum sp.]|nr:cbb3-type cytochrome c oxidase N-terminal domain-containing protein [Noviherbaspirillum sp.]
MADFTSGFWSIYIAVLTLLGIAGCAVLLWVQAKAKIVIPEGEQAEPMGHSWDEGLHELNNPMPRWWMWLFIITIVFSLVYLVLYPGLGAYAGKLGWQSAGQYEAEQRKADADFGPIFAAYQQADLKQVAADPQARAIGERLFMTYCAQCHASDARGSKGFPNLTDDDWLYGGEHETIKQTIANGRTGVMPPMAAAVGSAEDVRNL